FELHRSVLRGFGDRRSHRDGLGRTLWTSELRGLSPSAEQDRRHIDIRAVARHILGDILARGVGLSTRSEKFSAEGDAHLACLRIGDAGYVFGDFGTRPAQTAGARSR